MNTNNNIDKQYNIKDYIVNKNPNHHDDSNFLDEGQKEVYQFCAQFMTENELKKVVDIGCGSGYKLVNYLSEFETIGVETEPCFSLLNVKYPDRKWLISGEEEKSFNEYNLIKNNDVVLCCDVIEHVIDPDILLDYLISLNSKYYIVSTPCREILCKGEKYSPSYSQHWNGPPKNPCHVREWTMIEFIGYLSNKFDIINSFYGKDQIECQYHLLSIKSN